MPNHIVAVVGLTVGTLASPAAALGQEAVPPGHPVASCCQHVVIENHSDDHAESHADNGGLSRGGTILLGPSTGVAGSRQEVRNRQELRRERRRGHRRRPWQTARLVNRSHTNSAATSANTGEASGQGSTTTGTTTSTVATIQTVSNVQLVHGR